jgi:streptomycin 6-kinase
MTRRWARCAGGNPSETPLSESRAAVGLDEVAKLIGDLHRSGAPVLADGVVSLAERVELIFEHWVERHGRRGELVTRAVPVERLRRGHELARGLAADPSVSVLLHGDLHPGNVLDGGALRGLVAIDPRPCVGDAAFDSVDWVFWALDDPRAWEPRGGELAVALGVDHERLWTWCRALAALLAAGKAARGVDTDQIAALPRSHREKHTGTDGRRPRCRLGLSIVAACVIHLRARRSTWRARCTSCPP